MHSLGGKAICRRLDNVLYGAHIAGVVIRPVSLKIRERNSNICFVTTYVLYGYPRLSFKVLYSDISKRYRTISDL